MTVLLSLMQFTSNAIEQERFRLVNEEVIALEQSQGEAASRLFTPCFQMLTLYLKVM